MKKLWLVFMVLFSLSLIACNQALSTAINTTDLLSTQTTVTTNQPTTELTSIEATTQAPLDIKYQTSNNVYTLDVVLDTENDALSVKGEIYYKNDDFDLDEIYLTLYPNAKNDSQRTYNVVIDYITIDDMDYTYLINDEDPSHIYIDLEDTLIKGSSISIEFEYMFDYWQDLGRISKHDNEYLTMFFYPYVAMYDAVGWNLEPYTFQGEAYYNSIGDYYVSIDTPESYLVAASGELVATSNQDSRNVYTYELLSARDFSFSASENYFVYQQTEGDRVYSIYSLLELSSMNVYGIFSTMINTFERLESTIGLYPYDHYTLELGEFYGMESTGIAYCSYEFNEETLIHEITHQWFYSMVGNDQSDESFVDEAVTTYLTSLYYYRKSGVYGYEDYLDSRNSLDERFENRINLNQGVSLLKKVDDLGEQYGYLIYYHGPTLFRYYVDEFLQGDIEEFYRILSVYFDQYQYEEASLNMLLDVIETESGIPSTKAWFMMQIESFQSLDNRPL